MSIRSEWVVEFNCKKKELQKMVDLCADIGITLDSDNIVEYADVFSIFRSGDVGGDIEELKELKRNLIKGGASNISVRYCYPAEPEEVEI